MEDTTMNGWRFKQVVSMAAGVFLFLSPVAAQSTEPNFVPVANLPLDISRQIDFREHRGYEGWERGIPTHVKAQYAGGMGFISVGCGWDYGRKCRWETDVMVGFLPEAYSDRTHTIFTLKQNYIPWSVRCCDRFAIEPFSCGLYLTLITGEDYWVREPDRYPGDRYYGFTSRLRTHLYCGQRFTYYLKNDSLLRNITLYYELSANDLDIIAKCGNKSLGLSEIVYFSLGIKLQLLR